MVSTCLKLVNLKPLDQKNLVASTATNVIEKTPFILQHIIMDLDFVAVSFVSSNANHVNTTHTRKNKHHLNSSKLFYILMNHCGGGCPNVPPRHVPSPGGGRKRSHSSSKQPPYTENRWFKSSCWCTRTRDPRPPNPGLLEPKTTL